MERIRLGELLLKEKLVTQESMDKAIDLQKVWRKIGSHLS